ncbi:MAG: DNA replication/repair protein RecF [Bacteroidota bacterium]
MYLSQLSLINFKNCREASFGFTHGVNCFLGNNGEGKTNILDSIHYLSFCKSYFNPIDSQNIRNGEDFFVIQGNFKKEEEETEVYCGQKRNQKKSFKKNKKEYSRLSDHIGLFPLVMISPSDAELLLGGSEVRRKFIDSIISQYDKTYLEKLINYNKLLLQRNTLLKRFADGMMYNPELLEAWDIQLVPEGRYIFETRRKFINEFIRLFSKYYALIANNNEEVGVEYKSDLHTADFEIILKNSLMRDRHSQYTQTGIHKDDLVFTMNGQPVKRFGSQGQQKSFLISLKLAQYYYIAREKNTFPVLLLDDIFDKLDDQRVEQLMLLVTGKEFGQVFITDTSLEKLPSLLQKNNVHFKTFHIAGGEMTESYER